VSGNARDALDNDADNYDDDGKDYDDEDQEEKQKRWEELMNCCKYELTCFLFIAFSIYLLTRLLSTASHRVVMGFCGRQNLVCDPMLSGNLVLTNLAKHGHC